MTVNNTIYAALAVAVVGLAVLALTRSDDAPADIETPPALSNADNQARTQPVPGGIDRTPTTPDPSDWDDRRERAAAERPRIEVTPIAPAQIPPTEGELHRVDASTIEGIDDLSEHCAQAGGVRPMAVYDGESGGEDEIMISLECDVNGTPTVVALDIDGDGNPDAHVSRNELEDGLVETIKSHVLESSTGELAVLGQQREVTGATPHGGTRNGPPVETQTIETGDDGELRVSRTTYDEEGAPARTLEQIDHNGDGHPDECHEVLFADGSAERAPIPCDEPFQL